MYFPQGAYRGTLVIYAQALKALKINKNLYSLRNKLDSGLLTNYNLVVQQFKL